MFRYNEPPQERQTMRLITATVTGADNSINPSELVPITKRFGYVEWGILLSKTQQGNPRYPNMEWLKSLYAVWQKHAIPLSAHVCGEWARDFCAGKPTVHQDLGELWEMFDTIQLNIHKFRSLINQGDFIQCLKKFKDKQFIVPFAFDDPLLTIMENSGIHVFSLYDPSGGEGKTQENWPLPIEGKFCGYAGGLVPELLHSQLQHLAKCVKNATIWIDAETGLRNPEDDAFDLQKVDAYLRKAGDWV